MLFLNVKKINLYLANSMMSVKDLAEKSDVSLKTLWGIFKKGKSVRPYTAGKIARALGCSVEELL
jgi:DNA-binding Xre family transcriptional regulator